MTLLTLLKPWPTTVYTDGHAEIDFAADGAGSAIYVANPSVQVAFSASGEGIYIVETEGSAFIVFASTGVGIRVPTGDEIADWIVRPLPPASALVSPESVTLSITDITRTTSAVVTIDGAFDSYAVLEALSGPFAQALEAAAASAQVDTEILFTAVVSPPGYATAVVSVPVDIPVEIVAH